MTKTITFALALFITLIASSEVRADSIGVAFTQTSATGTAGSSITFDATLTNLSSSDTIFLNGDSSTTSSLFLTVEDIPFLTNFPLSLDPGASSGPFALFTLLINPGAIPGTYDFNSFSILGGLDPSSSDILGTANFSVTVTSPTTPVPEPPTIAFLLAGIIVCVALNRPFRNR